MRSPLRSYRPAPISPSTSLSISNCSTASATARRKSPSPAFSSSSASITLSSVIVSSRVLQVEVLQLHLSRPDRWPPQPHRSTLRVHPKIPPPAGTLTARLAVALAGPVAHRVVLHYAGPRHCEPPPIMLEGF